MKLFLLIVTVLPAQEPIRRLQFDKDYMYIHTLKHRALYMASYLGRPRGFEQIDRPSERKGES